MCRAPFAVSVVRIVAACSEKQMCRVAASAVVATMTNVLSRLDVKGQRVNDAMPKQRRLPTSRPMFGQDPVTVCVDLSAPRPTFIGAAPDDFWPNTFGQSQLTSTHYRIPSIVKTTTTAFAVRGSADILQASYAGTST